MSESNWTSSGYRPDEHGFWRATLDDRADLGYPVGYYFADSVRAIMTAFANFFNDMWVIRFDENGFPRKRIEVPLKFGPRAKSHDFRREQESGKTYYIPLPNMYYRIMSFQYDSTRAASSYSIRTFYEEYMMSKGVEEGQVQLLWNDTQPVPYNIGIELTAKAEKFSDLLQIVEQISSRFNPDAFIFIKEFWFMNIRRDVKMKLESIDLSYPEEMGEQEKRELEAKFTFTIEGQVYTKIEHGAIIDQIIMTINPSIAVYKSRELCMTLRGSKDPRSPYMFLEKDTDNQLVKDGILVRSENQMPNTDPGVETYKPADRYEDYFSLTEPYDQGVWKFTSGVLEENADKYESVIRTSGNYREEPGTFEPDTKTWEGSRTDRYDFTKLKEEDISSSGRKTYLNSGMEKVDTYHFTEHKTNA